MNNQIKSRTRTTVSKKRTESDDKNAVAIVKTVSQLGWVSQSGKQSRRNPMQKVLGPIRRIRFTESTLRQASIREKKGPSLGQNSSQSSLSAKSLRYEIWGPVPWRDWKTTAMCPKQGMEPCQKHTQAQREWPSYILLAPHCVNKRAGGKRVCGGFRGEYAYGQQERLLTLLSWRPWGHRGVRRRWWRPTAGCKQEKKRRCMSNNWT